MKSDAEFLECVYSSLSGAMSIPLISTSEVDWSNVKQSVLLKDTAHDLVQESKV